MNEELEDGDSSALLDGNSRFIEGTEDATTTVRVTTNRECRV